MLHGDTECARSQGSQADIEALDTPLFPGNGAEF